MSDDAEYKRGYADAIQAASDKLQAVIDTNKQAYDRMPAHQRKGEIRGLEEALSWVRTLSKATEPEHG